MQIIATCPCGQQYNADSAQVGTPLQCSTCGQVFVITASAYSNPQQAPQPNQGGYQLENRYGHPGPPPSPQAPLNPIPTNPNSTNPTQSNTTNPANEVVPLTPLAPNAAGLDGAASPSARPFTPPKRRANLKPLLIGIGCGVGGLVLVLLFMTLFRSARPSNGMDLTYLPANLSQFYFVNVGEMQSSKSGREFLNTDFFARQYFGSIEKLTQLKLEEIDSITVGYAEPESNLDPTASNPFAGINFGDFFNFCGVIRTKKDYDKEKIVASLSIASKQEHSGHEYYLVSPVKSALSDNTRAMAFPNSKTILYGSEKEIKAALTGSKAPNNSMFANVRPNDHVVVANNGGVQGLFGLENSGLSVSFGDEVSGRMWTVFESAKIARQVADAQQQMKTAVKILPHMMPAQHRNKFDQLLKEGDPFGYGDVQVSGKTVTATFKGQDKLVAKAALSQAVVGMLHQFQSFDSFMNPLNPSFVKKNINKAQQDAMDMAKRMQNDIQRINRAKENEKIKIPVTRKSGLKATNLASLPRYTPAGGRKINLLEVFDLTKDQVKGTWMFEGDSLVCKSIHFRPRIQFPYKPPEEFDLKVSFKQTSPRGSVTIIVPNDGKSYSWVLASSNVHQFTVSRIKKNDTKVRIDSIIKPNVTHTLVIQKRANSVKAVFDGHVLSEFKGDLRDLDEDRSTSLKNKELLGFSCETNTVVSVAELTEVKGKGSFVE